MTKSPSRLIWGACLLVLTGCAYGQPADRIAAPQIAAAFLPLQVRTHLGVDTANGAAMVFAPGVAVTNAHNANLVDPKQVIGTASQSDLMFFRVTSGAVPATAQPVPGQPVTAYGEGEYSRLRVAKGVVRQIVHLPGYADSPYFTYAADAGPGFSGGPVVDAQGQLVGITFGYKDVGGKRLMYAYDMARVRAEFRPFETPRESPGR